MYSFIEEEEEWDKDPSFMFWHLKGEWLSSEFECRTLLELNMLL